MADDKYDVESEARGYNELWDEITSKETITEDDVKRIVESDARAEAELRRRGIGR